MGKMIGPDTSDNSVSAPLDILEIRIECLYYCLQDKLRTPERRRTSSLSRSRIPRLVDFSLVTVRSIPPAPAG